MAIAIDSVTEFANASNVNVQTISHTCAGTDRGLLVFPGANANFASPGISVATYDSVAMTEIFANDPVGTGRYLSAYWLADPALGANDVFIDWGANAIMSFVVVSITGVVDGTPPFATVKKANSGNPSTNAITASSSALLFGVISSEIDITSIVEGSGQTKVGSAGTTGSSGIHVSSENATGGSDTMDWTGFSGERWSTTLIALEPAVAGTDPTIATIVPDPAVTGAELTITGTNYEAVQGTGGVTQEQGAVVVALTENTWAATEITADSATIESTGLKYGTQTLRVTNDSTDDGTKTFVANPPTDNAFVDLTSVATSGDRITAIPDLAANDQIRYEALLQQGGSPTIFTVVVNADATFSVDGSTPDGTFTFEVRAWDDGDQTWGTVADQTVVIGVVGPGPTPSTSTQAMVDHLISLGFIGGVTDLQMQWLESLGFSVGSVNDRWKAMLDAEPIAAGGMSERKRAFYETLAGSSPNASINELKRAYWLLR